MRDDLNLNGLKTQNIDIQVSTTPRERRKDISDWIANNSNLQEFELMSIEEREHVLNEIISIEKQLANVLKSPLTLTSNRFKSISKEDLMKTLRKYVFEECKRSVLTNFVSLCGSFLENQDEDPKMFFEMHGRK